MLLLWQLVVAAVHLQTACTLVQFSAVTTLTSLENMYSFNGNSSQPENPFHSVTSVAELKRKERMGNLTAGQYLIMIR